MNSAADNSAGNQSNEYTRVVTQDIFDDVKARAARGEPVQSIAVAVGFSVATIRKILRGGYERSALPTEQPVIPPPTEDRPAGPTFPRIKVRARYVVAVLGWGMLFTVIGVHCTRHANKKTETAVRPIAVAAEKPTEAPAPPRYLPALGFIEVGRTLYRRDTNHTPFGLIVPSEAGLVAVLHLDTSEPGRVKGEIYAYKRSYITGNFDILYTPR